MHQNLLFVIIDNFDIDRTSVRPAKADAKLVVDSYRMLSRSITTEGLQSISGRNLELIQAHCCV
jgi:hypothetical protein